MVSTYLQAERFGDILITVSVGVVGVEKVWIWNNTAGFLDAGLGPVLGTLAVGVTIHVV